MNQVERLAYLVVIALLAGALTSSVLTQSRHESSASFRHIEILDPTGRTRIVLGTDAAGAAEVRFVNGDGKKTSYIQQYPDGSTSLRFAGSDNEPSVQLDSGLIGPGPIFSLKGNHDDERIYLGAANYQDDVPSSNVYGWGLYVPAGGFKPPYAAVAAYKDFKTGVIRGFVLPAR